MGAVERLRADEALEGREPGRGAWRRGAFRWIDDETGERLRVEISGPPGLLAGLAELGFEPLADHPAIDVARVTEGRADVE